MIGLINSFETTGMVDGPGIRFVAFLAGCNLRCTFCHNPETWTTKDATKITANELILKILNYSDYYTNGGVTFSGGEPLLQPEFLLEMLKLCKQNDLHTVLDTSGVGLGDYKEILEYTDLVLLDIKDYRDDVYKEITSQTIDEFNNFVGSLNNSNKPVWIRQVIVPDVNDNKEYIMGLKEYLKKIKMLEKIELLPYHSLGKEKYEKLGIPYKLEQTRDITKKEIEELELYLK